MDNDRLRLLYGEGASPTSGPNSSPRDGSPLNRTVNNQHFSPSTSLHESQPLHPPPGLSLPTAYSNPAEQFQFSQTPAPGFQNYYHQNLYAPLYPQNFHNGMGQPNVYPFYNQSHYVHPMTHMAHPVYGTPITNEIELEDLMSPNVPLSTASTRDVYDSNPNYAQPQQAQSSTVGCSKPYTDPNTTIKPIIENIVGSMSMSNGTYTHFGPTFSTPATTSSSSPNLQRHPQCVSQNFSIEANVIMHPAMAVNDGINADIEDNGYSETPMQSLQIVNRMKEVGVFPIVPQTSTDAPYSHSVIVQAPVLHQPAVINGKESPVNGNNSTVGQISAAKENIESFSRPQTPGKPSYLEILTKSGPKGASTSAAVFRKASSTSASTSPVPYSSTSSTFGDYGNHQQSALGIHRKSGDFISSTSSTASSTCASASSSPVTKPKLISSNSSPSFYQSTAKGKENTSSGNSSGHNSKPSTSKNTPSASPIHGAGLGSTTANNNFQGQKQKSSSSSNEPQRKVLISSQNQHVLNGKANKLKRSSQGQFDFEIEDLDDENANSNSNWGWKTAGGKGRQPQSHNNNSIQPGNSKKPPIPYGNWIGNNGNSNGLAAATPLQQNTSNNNNSSEKKSNSSSNNSTSGSLSGSSLNISASMSNQSGGGGGSSQSSRKTREKEKPRSRKEDRNCVVRRVEHLTKVWFGHLLLAVTWLWSLVTDVTMLSFSLAYTILQDLFLWWQERALPSCRVKFQQLKEATVTMLKKVRWKGFGSNERKASEDRNFTSGAAGRGDNDDLLSLMGPERNITLPANGDEALKRLHSVKGQDPYSILGVRSDCSDETIRRYYKKQAVLVHPDKNLVPGAEEAFKILARAFELVGEPVKRVEYHQKILQAQAQEKVFGDIGNLFEQLRKKMEAASSSIRCTKCNSRHKKNRTDRPLFAARFCGQCKIHHAAREGDLWAERKGLFGWSWHYFACMDCHIWEINEWAKCQRKNLHHLKADSHSVMYRLVAGAGNGNQNSQGHSNNEDQITVDPENDDWDSLISNLCKGPSCATSRNGATHMHMGNGGCCGGGVGSTGNTTSGFNSATGRKRKGKRK